MREVYKDLLKRFGSLTGLFLLVLILIQFNLTKEEVFLIVPAILGLVFSSIDIYKSITKKGYAPTDKVIDLILFTIMIYIATLPIHLLLKSIYYCIVIIILLINMLIFNKFLNKS